jgi:hypothetical protein
MTKARDLADYTGLQADLAGLQTNITAGDTAARAGRKNLIINGGFNVSQRGSYTTATTTTHSQYYLDRFYVAKAGVTGTIQDTGFAVKLVATSSATGSLRITQPLEDMARLSGKTVTLSCQMKSNASTNSRIGIFADGWQSATAAHTGGGAWETLSITLTLPAGITTELSVHAGFDGVLSANIPISSGDYCEVKDFQLELGSVATDFEHRSYGEELALCQRYYQQYGTGIANTALVNGANWAGNNMYGVIQWKQPMRATPTVTFSSQTAWIVLTAGLSGATTYIATNTVNQYSAELNITANISITAGYSGWIRHQASSYMYVSAEL